MKKDDSLDLDKSVESRNQRVKRSASLFMASNVAVDDYDVQGEEQNEGGDLGNQAPKRRPKSMPLSFIAKSEESKEMSKLELSPSASMNFGVNHNYGFEAENANYEISRNLLEINFNSPGPAAPVRRDGSKSLLQFDNDLTIKGEFMDSESLEIEKYFGDNEQEKSSPSSSPKASYSHNDNVKKNITDKSQ